MKKWKKLGNIGKIAFISSTVLWVLATVFLFVDWQVKLNIFNYVYTYLLELIGIIDWRSYINLGYVIAWIIMILSPTK